ncbi:MAG TPA: hypothetical protein VKE74_01890 [Gemmataceae bacterium]|nr:hypothetical protein [Gemmataceae bacterium]
MFIFLGIAFALLLLAAGIAVVAAYQLGKSKADAAPTPSAGPGITSAQCPPPPAAAAVS